jgi:hypothetical protein
MDWTHLLTAMSSDWTHQCDASTGELHACTQASSEV